MQVQARHNFSDEELVVQYCMQQNNTSLGVLFERYQHLVVSVAYKYFQDKDLAKDALMQIFEHLVKVLPQQKDIANFKAWLMVVTKNHCLMQLRKAKLPTRHVENIENYDVENTEDVHLTLQKEDQLNKMELAMQQLDEKQKTCLQLFYLQKKSYADIQSQTGFTFMEVKSFIQNGKRNLKNLMTQ